MAFFIIKSMALHGHGNNTRFKLPGTYLKRIGIHFGTGTFIGTCIYTSPNKLVHECVKYCYSEMMKYAKQNNGSRAANGILFGKATEEWQPPTMGGGDDDDFSKLESEDLVQLMIDNQRRKDEMNAEIASLLNACPRQKL